MYRDLDPVLDRLAELLKACNRADLRGDRHVPTELVRQVLGGPARTVRVLAEAGVRV